MSLQTVCPLPANLSQITPTTCAQHFGQIVRVAFQRVGSPFVNVTSEIEWDAALVATSALTITLTDFCENVLIPAGEAITEGGDDNSTLYGQALVVGKGQVTVSGRFRGLTATSKASMEQFVSESSIYNQLGVYLINEFGQVISSDVPVGGTTAIPFPIQSFFISDVDSQGYNTHNFNMFQWNFVGGWSDAFRIDTLSWDILGK